MSKKAIYDEFDPWVHYISGRAAARPDSRVPSTTPRPSTRLLWPKLGPLAVTVGTHHEKPFRNGTIVIPTSLNCCSATICLLLRQRTFYTPVRSIGRG
jgi:hypothetical protein